MSLKLRGGIWHFRKMIRGETLAFSTKTSDEKLAKVIATIKEAEFLREMMLGGKRAIKLHAAIDLWLKAKATAPGHKIAKYHIEKFKALPNKALHELKEIEAQTIVDQRKLVAKPSSVAVMVSCWNALMNFVDKHGYRTGPKLPKIKGVQGKIRFLTPEEAQAWLDSVDPNTDYPGKNPVSDTQRQDNWDLIVGLLDLGCRYHELANMAKTQVNLAANEITVYRGKGGKASTLIMTPRLREVMTRRMQIPGEHVFPTKFGKNNNGAWVKNSRRRAGIGDDVSLHTCRHTFATTLLKKGMDILSVKELLGHADLKSTLVYTHQNPTDAAHKAARILADQC